MAGNFQIITRRWQLALKLCGVRQVLGAGKTDGAMDAANLLKPMLARGELRCIGATTIGEYRQHMEKDAAFERRFQQVRIAGFQVHMQAHLTRAVCAEKLCDPCSHPGL